MMTSTLISTASLGLIFSLAAIKPDPAYAMLSLCGVLGVFLAMHQWWEHQQKKRIKIWVVDICQQQRDQLLQICHRDTPLLCQVELIRFADKHIRPSLPTEQSLDIDDAQMELWIRESLATADNAITTAKTL